MIIPACQCGGNEFYGGTIQRCEDLRCTSRAAVICASCGALRGEWSHDGGGKFTQRPTPSSAGAPWFIDPPYWAGS